MSMLTEQISARKPFIFGLIIGLLAGPIISGIMGWQVTSTFLQRSVHAAVVKQQVEFCQMRVNAAVKNIDKLDYSGRYDLAKTWAKLPGQTEAESDVVNGCANGMGT